MEETNEFDEQLLSIIKKNIQNINFDKFLHITDEDKTAIKKYKEFNHQRCMRMAIKFVDEMPEWKKNCLILASQSTNSKPRKSINPSDYY